MSAPPYPPPLTPHEDTVHILCHNAFPLFASPRQVVCGKLDTLFARYEAFLYVELTHYETLGST